MTNEKSLIDRVKEAYYLATGIKFWTNGQFFDACDEVGIGVKKIGDDVVEFFDTTADNVVELEKRVSESKAKEVEIPEPWTVERLALIGLTPNQCAPTMLFQAIQTKARERKCWEWAQMAHGPIANGRDKMACDVLSELLDRVMSAGPTREEKQAAADAEFEKIFGEAPQEIPFDDGPKTEFEKLVDEAGLTLSHYEAGLKIEGTVEELVETGKSMIEVAKETAAVLADALIGKVEEAAVSYIPILKDAAPFCESESCASPAAWLVGAKEQFYLCDEHEKTEHRNLKKRVRLEDAKKAEQEKQDAKQAEQDRKDAEAKALAEKYDQIGVLNPFTGNIAPLEYVTRYIWERKQEIAARERTCKDRVAQLEAEIKAKKDCYNASVLEVLDDKLPREKDGSFHRKSLSLSLCKLKGKKTGGIRLVDRNELLAFAAGLSEAERAMYGFTLVVDYDLDVLKAMVAAGIPVPGLEEEEEKELGDWDVE